LKPAKLSDAARQDVRAIVAWIARDNPRAAREFRTAVQRAGLLLGEHPEIGSLRTEIAAAPFRLFVLKDYPYVLIYNAERTPPLILRVLHGARDLPDALQGR